MNTDVLPSQPPAIEKFVWDLTYACPLRCVHCYSESGRRPARALSEEQMEIVVDAIISAGPKGVSFAGGEPLLVPWWAKAARRIKSAGIPVTVSTSGWLMDEAIARDLAETVAHVVVSIDGATDATNDAIRGREGSLQHALKSLALLTAKKEALAAEGTPCFSLGVDYTVTQKGKGELDQFVEMMTERFPSLDHITFGAAVPCGLAEEEGFDQLLTEAELDSLAAAKERLAGRAKSDTNIDVTDVRLFRPGSALSKAGDTHAHLEPDGQLRAFATYEAKVGSILEVPVQELWERALAWRSDPFVAGHRDAIRTVDDWARVGRLLDQKYGSEADLVRIAKRRESRTGA